MNWKVVLALLTCNVLFMSASYTMIIPFLPMYLTNELGVDDTSVSLWAGLSFSVTFFVSAVMAPIWGRIADRKGKRLMAMRASLLIAISYLLGGIVTSPEQLIIVRVFQGFASGLWPMDLPHPLRRRHTVADGGHHHRFRRPQRCDGVGGQP